MWIIEKSEKLLEVEDRLNRMACPREIHLWNLFVKYGKEVIIVTIGDSLSSFVVVPVASEVGLFKIVKEEESVQELIVSWH